MTRVLIAGVSTRGLAESAARAGYEVAAVDGFGDLDLRAAARDVVVAREWGGKFSAARAARCARSIDCDAVAYVASFENDPRAVRALARGRSLWGNPPTVLGRVRDPRRLAGALAAAGLPAPAVRFTRPRAAPGTAWLIKPLRSGGGHGVRPWRPGVALPRGAFLQRRVSGVPGAIVFAADGASAVPLGLSRILVGERSFGADGFRYAGNILGAAGDAQFTADAKLLAGAAALAGTVTRAFGLIGVNGIDFIARRGIPYAIEVNPRYTASLELVERAYGLPVFEIHARACAGRLPAFDLGAARSAGGAHGKAIVYARRDSVAGDTRSWLEDESVRDVPAPGARLPRGAPICTVLARGRDAAECRAALARRASRVYETLEAGAARTA